MRASLVSLVVAAGVALVPVVAAAQAEKSLEKCQKTVGKEIGKYAATKQKTIAKCLDKIAKERIKHAEGDAAGAAKGCASARAKAVNMPLGEMPCWYADYGYSFEDAEVMAVYWEWDDVSDAKLKMTRMLIKGNDAELRAALKAAKAERGAS